MSKPRKKRDGAWTPLPLDQQPPIIPPDAPPPTPEELAKLEAELKVMSEKNQLRPNMGLKQRGGRRKYEKARLG